jgi:hypothetical protein
MNERSVINALLMEPFQFVNSLVSWSDTSYHINLYLNISNGYFVYHIWYLNDLTS